MVQIQNVRMDASRRMERRNISIAFSCVSGPCCQLVVWIQVPSLLVGVGNQTLHNASSQDFVEHARIVSDQEGTFPCCPSALPQRQAGRHAFEMLFGRWLLSSVANTILYHLHRILAEIGAILLGNFIYIHFVVAR